MEPRNIRFPLKDGKTLSVVRSDLNPTTHVEVAHSDWDGAAEWTFLQLVVFLMQNIRTTR